MNLSRFATGQIKAVVFVTLVLCAIGAWVARSFPVSILPDVTFPRLVVITESGDRPTRMMEAGIVRPIEEAIATVPGVTRMRTKIQRGASETSVDFTWGADMMTALQLVDSRINEVRPRLPPETRIHMERMNPTVFPVFGISLRATNLTPTQLWTLATYDLQPKLTRIHGVARVVVQGGAVPEIAVEADPLRLAAHNLTLADIEQAITQTNVVRSVGKMDSRFQQHQLLVSGEIDDPDALGDIVVAQRGGVPIKLSQVAEIRPSKEDRTTIVTADGKESVLLNIVRQPDANTVSVVAEVKAELDRLRPTLPNGAEVGIFYNQSILIGEAIASVRDAVLIGAALAVFVLLLFLRDLRATVVTAAIIPATVLITLLLMRLSGLTLNLMTLGALAVGIGLVIDDAIVVVENVHRHLLKGVGSKQAVLDAAGEIAAPMISSTLTTVVVFLPLILLTGVAGAFFSALAITLAIALMVSLVLALTVSPSLCAAFLKHKTGQSNENSLSSGLARVYHRALGRLLKMPILAPIVCAVIIGATVVMAGRLDVGFMPTMDEGAFILDFWTPPGTSLTESDRLLQKVEAMLHDTPEISAYSRRTGTELGFAVTEPNRGDFAIMLKRNRKRSLEQVIDGLREEIKKKIPGLDADFVEVLQDLIGDLAGAPSPIEIKFFGTDSEVLETVAKKVSARIEKLKGTVDVKNGIIEMGPEMVAKIDPIRAGRLGISPDSAADQATSAFLGNIVTRLLQGDRQMSVRVRYPASIRTDPDRWGRVEVKSAAGFRFPLSSIGKLQVVQGTAELTREDQRRMIAVSARLSERDLGSAMKEVQEIMRTEKFPAGVTYQFGGQFRSQTETFQNLYTVLTLAIVLVFTVMLFQFKSFTAPVVILLIMPLSLFGVALGLLVTKTSLNVSSMMGAVMLVGIVVKNGILLLDRAREAENQGMEVAEAVQTAGEVRLRPILMTTLTALFGLVPLALGLGPGAEMQKPLAIAVIGGLSFSTVWTLLLAPVFYVSMRRWQVSRFGEVDRKSVQVVD